MEKQTQSDYLSVKCIVSAMNGNKRRTAMCKRILNVFATALLLVGMAAALAKDTARLPLGAPPSGDTLALTHVEKKMAWHDLSRLAVHYYGVPWFEAIDRWVLPKSVKVKPITRRASRDVPALAPYAFAVVEGDLLIVNPLDRTVAAVIRPYKRLG
jgi:hypothetical protein